MNRGEILKQAEKHCHLTAGWIFSVPGLEDFWAAAFAAGAKAELEACCTLLEGMHETQMGNHNYYQYAANTLRDHRSKP